MVAASCVLFFSFLLRRSDRKELIGVPYFYFHTSVVVCLICFLQQRSHGAAVLMNDEQDCHTHGRLIPSNLTFATGQDKGAHTIPLAKKNLSG